MREGVEGGEGRGFTIPKPPAFDTAEASSA